MSSSISARSLVLLFAFFVFIKFSNQKFGCFLKREGLMTDNEGKGRKSRYVGNSSNRGIEAGADHLVQNFICLNQSDQSVQKRCLENTHRSSK